jgi:hypothetical protein
MTAWKHQAATDRDQIQNWWESVGFNIGIACGPSGLLVVDWRPEARHRRTAQLHRLH